MTYKHGQWRTRTFAIWAGIRNRCVNPKFKDYKYYGGRGIGLCERWASFTNFLADMGPAPPGTSIDRIDNAKGYEPTNCRWATQLDQQRNRRNNLRLTFRGETLAASAWAERFGMDRNTLYARLKTHSVEEALTMPVRQKNPEAYRRAWATRRKNMALKSAEAPPSHPSV